MLDVIVSAAKSVASSEAPKEIQQAEEFYKESLEEQKPYQKIWYRNIALLAGFQWCDWDESRGFLLTPPAPSWRVRMVTNMVLPIVRTEAAKILKTSPIMKAVPANASEIARASARIGDRVLEGRYYSEQEQRKLYQLVMWMLSCGSAYYWSLYDGTAGRRWTDTKKDAAGMPILDAQGNPVEQEYFEGEVVSDVSNPFETLLEPGASEDFEEHQRIMRVKLRSLKYIKDRYGLEVAPESSMETLFQQRINSMGSMLGASGALGKQAKDSALVKDYFVLPNREYPEGLHMVYVGNQFCVEPEAVDYWRNGKKALPTAKFDHITIPGRVQGMSVIEQIGPLNVILNKMDSQVVENSNILSRPKVLAPQGSLDQDTFTTEPGEVVEYVPIAGMKPEAWKPPEMPQYFFTMKDAIPGKIQDVSGIYDISVGKLPRRATSGKAIDLLQDADDTRMGLTIRNFGSSLERVKAIELETIKRKYRETRLLKSLGKDHEIEILEFKGSDLKDCETVRVAIGSALSRAAKVQIGLELIDKEVIPKEMALKIMELGDLNIAFDNDQPQVNYATFENLNMAKGVMYPVGQLEQHDVHIEEHERFFREHQAQLPPEAQQIFAEHIAEHRQHKALALAEAAGPAPMPPGAAPMPPQDAGGALPQ